MGLWASRPRPVGVISARTHTPTQPGPKEAGAATPDLKSSTDHAPAYSTQRSAAPAAPSGPDKAQPYGPSPATQDSADSSAGEAISLAAALLGLPAAPGHYSPPDEVPGPWVDLFLERHADSGVYRGLFRASGTTRQWVLQHAATADYTVYVSSRLHADAWVKRFNALRAALGVRGQRPTQLSVTVSDAPEAECALAALPTFIWGVGQGVTGLHFGAYLSSSEPASAFLRCMALAAPNVTTLTLTYGSCTLPPPDRFPHLREIIMKSMHLDSCVSVAAYLPQLTSLTFHPKGAFHRYDMLSAVISTQTTTLTRLHTTAHLNDNALGLLLAHTPALTDLSVGPVTVESDEYSGRVWGVKRLSTSLNHWRREKTAVELWQLPYLPTCRTGTVLCTTEFNVDITDEQVRETVVPTCVHTLMPEK